MTGRAVRPSAGARVMRFLMPIGAGFLLDAVDLMTFGPVGLWTGLLVGGAAGWLLSPYLGFSEQHRWWGALLAGVYCALPFTAFVPLATLLGLASNFLSVEPGPVAADDPPGQAEPPAIDADYTARDEEREASGGGRKGSKPGRRHLEIVRDPDSKPR